MKILYFDPQAGVSGDLFLGALVDLGVDFDALTKALQSLAVPGFSLTRSATKRHTIAATKVDVVVEDVPHPHRHLPDLVKIINASPLSSWVKKTSIAVLTKLAEAESRVHRQPLQSVHLHEVGGLDCLVDVVGSVWAIHELMHTHGVEKIYSGPVSVGSGFVKCAHGNMPLPAPGTLAILEGFPLRRTTFPFEMTTPTGAALLSTLAEAHTTPMIFTPKAVGYGAGTRDPKEVANLFRVVLAELHQAPALGKPLSAPHVHEHTHEHGHSHTHAHSHDDHGHAHSHSHEHEHDHSHDHEHSHDHDHKHADHQHSQ